MLSGNLLPPPRLVTTSDPAILCSFNFQSCLLIPLSPPFSGSWWLWSMLLPLYSCFEYVARKFVSLDDSFVYNMKILHVTCRLLIDIFERIPRFVTPPRREQRKKRANFISSVISTHNYENVLVIFRLITVVSLHTKVSRDVWNPWNVFREVGSHNPRYLFQSDLSGHQVHHLILQHIASVPLPKRNHRFSIFWCVN